MTATLATRVLYLVLWLLMVPASFGELYRPVRSGGLTVTYGSVWDLALNRNASPDVLGIGLWAVYLIVVVVALIRWRTPSRVPALVCGGVAGLTAFMILAKVGTSWNPDLGWGGVDMVAVSLAVIAVALIDLVLGRWRTGTKAPV